MTDTIAALRAAGARPVILTTSDGTYAGSIVPDRLSESSVMIEFMLDGDPERQIVIAVDGITGVMER